MIKFNRNVLNHKNIFVLDSRIKRQSLPSRNSQFGLNEKERRQMCEKTEQSNVIV